MTQEYSVLSGKGFFYHRLHLNWNECVPILCFPVLNMFTFSLSIQEFVKGCSGVTKHWVDTLLDKMTADDHTKAVNQIRQVSNFILDVQNYIATILQGILDQL